MVYLRNEEAFRRALNHARTWYKRTFMARLIFAWLAIYDLCNAFFLEIWPLIELFSCIFQISCATHTSDTTRQPLTTPRPWDNIATGYVATSPTPSNLWFCTWRRSTGESHKRIRLSLSRYTLSSFFSLARGVSRAKTQDRYRIWTSEKPVEISAISRTLDSSFKIKVWRISEIRKRYEILVFANLWCYKDFALKFLWISFCNYTIFYKFQKLQILLSFTHACKAMWTKSAVCRRSVLGMS